MEMERQTEVDSAVMQSLSWSGLVNRVERKGNSLCLSVQSKFLLTPKARYESCAVTERTRLQIQAAETKSPL